MQDQRRQVKWNDYQLKHIYAFSRRSLDWLGDPNYLFS